MDGLIDSRPGRNAVLEPCRCPNATNRGHGGQSIRRAPLSIALAWISTAAAGGWTLLQDEQVRVRCELLAERTRCEASAHLGASVSAVSAVIADVAAYPSVFASVREVQATSADGWSVWVDLPWPLTRSRVEARLEQVSTPTGLAWNWTNTGPEGPIWSDARWTVVPESGGTRVLYAWTAPAWSLPASVRRGLLRRQGHNTVWAVALATESTPSVP